MLIYLAHKGIYNMDQMSLVASRQDVDSQDLGWWGCTCPTFNHMPMSKQYSIQLPDVNAIYINQTST
jgi:hypothetical protein